MNPFSINYASLRELLLPVKLRGQRMLAWLGALTLPVEQLYASFIVNRAANVYGLSFNGQVCRLEGLLNDTFDMALRRIVILDTPTIDSFYIYRSAELKTRFIYHKIEPDHTYIRSSMETVGYLDEFIVQVPMGLVYDAALMVALINEYRLASKKFSIVTI